jgi:hypothetical protein
MLTTLIQHDFSRHLAAKVILQEAGLIGEGVDSESDNDSTTDGATKTKKPCADDEVTAWTGTTMTSKIKTANIRTQFPQENIDIQHNR